MSNKTQKNIVDTYLNSAQAAAVLHAFAICDAEGRGPTMGETRELVEYIVEQYPDVAAAWHETPCVREVLAK